MASARNISCNCSGIWEAMENLLAGAVATLISNDRATSYKRHIQVFFTQDTFTWEPLHQECNDRHKLECGAYSAESV